MYKKNAVAHENDTTNFTLVAKTNSTCPCREGKKTPLGLVVCAVENTFF